ncbi:MAG: FAD-binding oxidoreductase [Actinomycetota bacterium]
MSDLSSLSQRLPEGVISTHPGELTTRARDLWAMALLRERIGDRVPPPSAIAFPRSTDDVATILAWAEESQTPIVPRGGGSGVCGGAQAVRGSVVVDLSEMSHVLSVDEQSLTVEVEAGIRGERLERQLSERGLTLGHYPQSLAISSAGGWIATSSAGQASAGYGVIEDLVLGMTVVLPGGKVVRLQATPRSAAGPDLKRLFVGSEGTLGIITEATFSVSRSPDGLRWEAFAPADFAGGIELVRSVVQRGLRSLVVRLYDDTDANLVFGEVGHQGGPVLVLALAGNTVGGSAQAEAMREEAGRHGARTLPSTFGDHWWDHRLDAVDTYRRIMGEERLLGDGVVVDTMEVAGLWSQLPKLYRAVQEALARRAEAVGCHLSHPYRSGASLYFTFLLRAPDDRRVRETYVSAWRDAATACQDAGGTITHHHGVGILKSLFMERELGAEGLRLLRTLKSSIDPNNLLNPGKLLPPDG